MLSSGGAEAGRIEGDDLAQQFSGVAHVDEGGGAVTGDHFRPAHQVDHGADGQHHAPGHGGRVKPGHGPAEGVAEAADHGVHVLDEDFADDVVGHGVEAAHELAVVGGRLALGVDHGAEKGFEDAFQRQLPVGMLGLESVEHLEAADIHRIEAACDQGFQEGFLRLEVVVDGGQVDAGFGGDCSKGDVETALGDEAFGGVENSNFRFIHTLVLNIRSIDVFCQPQRMRLWGPAPGGIGEGRVRVGGWRRRLKLLRTGADRTKVRLVYVCLASSLLAGGMIASAQSQADSIRSAMEASLQKQRESIRKQMDTVGTAPASSGTSPSFYTVPWPKPVAMLPADCDPLPKPKVDELVTKAAQTEGVQPDVIRQVIQRESGFKPCAISVKGAQGLMQLMPATASQYGVKDPFSPEENVAAGTKFLKELLAKYNGNMSLALAAYNAGPGTVDKANGVPNIPETQSYVADILSKLML